MGNADSSGRDATYDHITAKVLRDRSTNQSTKVIELFILHCLSSLLKCNSCDNMHAVFNIREDIVEL